MKKIYTSCAPLSSYFNSGSVWDAKRWKRNSNLFCKKFGFVEMCITGYGIMDNSIQLMIAHVVFFIVTILLWIVGRYEYRQKELKRMKAKGID